MFALKGRLLTPVETPDDPVRAGVGRRGRVDHRPARPRNGARAHGHRADAAVGRGRADVAVRAGARWWWVWWARTSCRRRTTGCQRVVSFLDPFSDFAGTGYQAANSIYAFATGGWWGGGLEGQPAQVGPAAEAHTDFIFSILGEELGLPGALMVLGLFFTLGFAGIRIAMRTTRPVHPAGGGRHHRLADRPGDHQPRQRPGRLPGHRRAAAAGVVRGGCFDGRRHRRCRHPDGAGQEDPAPAQALAALRRRGATRQSKEDPRGEGPSWPAVAPPAHRRCWRRPPRCAAPTRTPRSPLLGTERGLEVRLVPERGYELALIPPVPLPRGRRRPAAAAHAGAHGRAPDRPGAAVAAGRRAGRLRRVRRAAGVSGRAPRPACRSSCTRRTPSRAWPTAWAPRFTSATSAMATPGIELPHAQHVGIPLRRTISQLDRPGVPGRGRRAFFGLDPSLPTLLVFGGSQGARRINEAVAGALDPLIEGRLPGAARRRARERRGSRRVGPPRYVRCRATSTGWTWPTPPPISPSAAPVPSRAPSWPRRRAARAVYVPCRARQR